MNAKADRPFTHIKTKEHQNAALLLSQVGHRAENGSDDRNEARLRAERQSAAGRVCRRRARVGRRRVESAAGRARAGAGRGGTSGRAAREAINHADVNIKKRYGAYPVETLAAAVPLDVDDEPEAELEAGEAVTENWGLCARIASRLWSLRTKLIW